MKNASECLCSVAISTMGGVELALYGFRSWLLQDIDEPYEVIVNLFNDAAPRFEALREGANPHCRVFIRSHPAPAFYNISASNNLGIHFARGRYVLVVNADIIYRADLIRRSIADLDRRQVAYALASRVNLTEEQTRSLQPPAAYTRENGFADLAKLPHEPSARWHFLSPWIIRRDIAHAVGGWDPRVLMAEDMDISARVMHYLRRTGQQTTLYHLPEADGYHLWHTSTGLFDAYTQSKAIFGPRNDRLSADPGSTEDVLPSDLDDGERILSDIRQTQPPPLRKHSAGSLVGVARRRFNKAWQALRRG
jgi:hypothetical protein